jgi:hypothetical protein
VLVTVLSAGKTNPEQACRCAVTVSPTALINRSELVLAASRTSPSAEHRGGRLYTQSGRRSVSFRV